MRAQRIKTGYEAGAALAVGGAFVFCCGLAGCQSGPELPMARASALVNGQITIGMSRKAVDVLLGIPHHIEANGTTEFLFYNVPWMMKPGTPGSNPIAIVDGKVAGTGLIYYYKNRAPN
jgi:hypothetical protein